MLMKRFCDDIVCSIETMMKSIMKSILVRMATAPRKFLVVIRQAMPLVFAGSPGTKQDCALDVASRSRFPFNVLDSTGSSAPVFCAVDSLVYRKLS